MDQKDVATIPCSQLEMCGSESMTPWGCIARIWSQKVLGPVFFLIIPSAPQALKKDEDVPWTGMLAIVHSYVTHKTGKGP